jgi:Fe-S-cluster containining protein
VTGGLDLEGVRARAERAAEEGSPTEARLREAVHALRARRWRRPLAWWRHRRTVDDRPLDPSRLERRAPTGRGPDCGACAERCCTGPHVVSLRLADLARLHDAGLGGCVDTRRPTDRLAVWGSSPRLMEAEQSRLLREFPRLPRPDGRCVFHDAEGRCAIHPIRPAVCRAYPFQIDEDRRGVRWAGACASAGDDAEALERGVRDAVAHDRSKQDDLLVLALAPELPAALGLGGYAPSGPDFGAVLARRRAVGPGDQSDQR